MRFSIVIPTYNRAHLLRAALDSIFEQTFTDYEVIVVDDGSTDDTAQLAASYGSKIRFLRQQNRGPGAARNLGAQHAIGEYLAFLDSDDLWFPWSLETYLELVEQYLRPAFLAGKPFRFQEDKELLMAKDGVPQAIVYRDYLSSGEEWRWWGVSSFVIRRDFFENVGKFTDEWVNGEDADLALRLAIAPGFVQVISPPTFAYREHENSAMKSLSKTLAGIWLSIQTEHAGKYPGGAARAHERWRILSRHIRPVTFECWQQGLRQEAWRLYLRMFRWNIVLGRWKYLVGFPVKVLFSSTK